MAATLTTPRHTTVLSHADCAEALFAASLACGDFPAEGQVTKTVIDTVARLGVRGCAAEVAAEFGEHPELAVLRMRRARELVGGLAVTGEL